MTYLIIPHPINKKAEETGNYLDATGSGSGQGITMTYAVPRPVRGKIN
jgi:hypothetical protein